MQFDRQPDGTDKPLRQTGVDTGMGLERLCAIIQDKDSVYETDLFVNIIKKIEELTGITYAAQDQATKAAFHVLADHSRSSTMLIADGCAPSNEGRGYVLRKIIRRAALFAQKLSDKNIFPQLSATVIADFADVYPELKASEKQVFDVLASEINKFSANLVRGNALLKNYFATHQAAKIITGTEAFKLYDTFGFPTELIEIMARENGFTVDMQGFEREMQKQKEQSGKKSADQELHVDLDPSIVSEFTGYTELSTPSVITALVVDSQVVSSVPAGQTCYAIAQKSPFFIVGGGQVPDQGWLTINGHQVSITTVRYINNAIAAEIKAPVDLTVGMAVTSTVDKVWRANAMKNHTATHMLQAALIEVLGKQVKQAGSLVHPDYLRFDFTCHDPLAPETIKRVEDLVNEKIREDIKLAIEYTSMKEAGSRGALAFFGDKYNPEKVRIVDIPGFSAELCGGTHVPSTGMIGTFKITDIVALAAGYKRIFAVTGPAAIDLFQESFAAVKNLSQEFKVKREEVLDAVHKQKEQLKQVQNQLKGLKKELLKAQIPVWLTAVQEVNGIPFLALMVEDLSSEELKDTVIALQNKKPGFYFIASRGNEKNLFVGAIAESLLARVDIKTFATWLKDTHGLRGGGSQFMLQGGGNFDEALFASIRQWLAEQK
jgi:alanyl-tRNA synthetase